MISKEFHLKKCNIPFLISPKFLRLNNLGQIDISYLDQSNNLQVLEVKSNKRSEISVSQILRLRRSCDYLGKVLNLSVFFEFKRQD